MGDIIDTLVQEIEQGAFPHFSAKKEYRQQQFQALMHMNWLEEHLDEEEKSHLEQARAADTRLDTLEREAITRVALAVGIQLATPK